MIHSHCLKCYSIKTCSSGNDGLESCMVISCPLDCGSHFHACKMKEHKLLCMNEEVSCINSVSGCPRKLLRHQQAPHLETCPASIVICTVEWNRRDASLGELTGPVHSTQNEVLDIALLRSDQRKINGLMKISETEHHTLCSSKSCSACAAELNEKLFSVLEDTCTSCDSVAFHKDYEQDIPQPYSAYPSDCNNTQEDLNRSENSFHMNSFQNSMNNSENDMRVCSNVFGCDVARNDIDYNNIVFFDSLICDILNTNYVTLSPSVPPCTPITNPVFLNLTLESFTKYQNKNKNIYTFLCGKVFRRDEYSWHYKNVHSDIHGSLNGWIEHRCPLACYGCTYSQRRFYASREGSHIIFSKIMQSFGIELNDIFSPLLFNNDQTISKDTESFDHNVSSRVKFCNDSSHVTTHQQNGKCLVDLPCEVLRHILKYLDSFSLCNMALTCRYIRNVCGSLLLERGIVSQHWKKKIVESKVTWTVDSNRWFFSTAFSPVRKWGFQEQKHMSEHLQSCSFFERCVRTRPFPILKV